MNKQKFHQLLRDFKDLPDTDLRKLEELEKTYPYSQVIHALVAKAHFSIRSELTKQKLSQAAIYATNRGALKHFVEGITPVSSSPTKPFARKIVTPKPTVQKITPIKPLEKTETEASKKHREEIEHIREEIYSTLRQLQVSKKDVNELTDKYVEEEAFQNPLTVTPPSSVEKEDQKKDIVTEEKIKKVKKSQKKPLKQPKEDQIIESTDASSTHTSHQTSPYIEELVNTKAEKSIGIKQKQQQDIIENFIKAEPSIKKASQRKKTPEEQEQENLAQKSTEFKEELISENLAKIMLMQGKKSKAIDIYKKLIWKYPQKKTYFAGQIEELEK
ncbi:MAG: hypothetical protein OEX02_02630 [Cyclobacteriaceae bacterium]|nr:hypothetical protein [Cyclobacteriaceae bacterium]